MSAHQPDAGIDALLFSVDKDVLIDVGWQLYRDDQAAAQMHSDELLAAGTKWVKANYQKMKDAICPHSDRIQSLLTSDVSQAVQAAGDLMLGLAVGVSPFTLGRLCVQMGVNKLCSGA
jgi:hypothetical protein